MFPDCCPAKMCNNSIYFSGGWGWGFFALGQRHSAVLLPGFFLAALRFFRAALRSPVFSPVFFGSVTVATTALWVCPGYLVFFPALPKKLRAGLLTPPVLVMASRPWP